MSILLYEWEGTGIRFLLVVGLAILPLYLNMRTVRVVKCDECLKRAKFVRQKSKLSSFRQTLGSKIWTYATIVIERHYVCKAGHLTRKVCEQEVNRPAHAVWQGRPSNAIYWHASDRGDEEDEAAD